MLSPNYWLHWLFYRLRGIGEVFILHFVRREPGFNLRLAQGVWFCVGAGLGIFFWLLMTNVCSEPALTDV
ncbi:hypothetical protein [Coleofasciculus sp.]|uniref:hypothetical protein n=1 Tax=Coleofasciculus sp. TaxID=3100458 RepID=UPI003A29027F